MGRRPQLRFFLPLLLGLASAEEVPTFSSLGDFPLDQHGHLESNWLLFESHCRGDGAKLGDVGGRSLAYVEGALATTMKLSSEDPCPVAVALERGTLLKHVPYHVDRFDASKSDFQDFVQEISRIEIGWMNYHGDKIRITWVAPDGEELLQHDLKYGEQNTQWRTAFLGHRFRAYDLSADPDPKTGAYPLLKDMTASYNEIHVIGKQPPLEEGLRGGDHAHEIQDTDAFERRRAKRVLRTFTEHGFSKVPVPLEVWGSMHTYYYNNQRNIAREEWGGKGVYVNWWESDPYMIQPPFGLKRKWHDALRPMAEEWVGVELEDTDLYGMRKYTEGAKLVKHVDRESTHAVSMIINIDQSHDMIAPGLVDQLEGQVVGGAPGKKAEKEPWLLEIHDHQTEEPQFVDMAVGDMVFYESARCMHGRPRALQGQYYVNLFTHYRPKVAGAGWYKENKATAVLDGEMVELEVAKEMKRKATEEEEDQKVLPRGGRQAEESVDVGGEEKEGLYDEEEEDGEEEQAEEGEDGHQRRVLSRRHAKRAANNRQKRKASAAAASAAAATATAATVTATSNSKSKLLHPSAMGEEEAMRSESLMGLGDKVAAKAREDLKAKAKESAKKKWKKTKGIFSVLWERKEISAERRAKQQEVHEKRIRRMSLPFVRTVIDHLVVRPLRLNTHFSEMPLPFIAIFTIAFGGFFVGFWLVACGLCCPSGGSGGGARRPASPHGGRGKGKGDGAFKASSKSGSGGSDGFGFGFDTAAASRALAANTGLPESVARAAANGKTAVVKKWVAKTLKEGGSLDLGDANDRTALALAAKGGHEGIVRVLLANQCDTSPTDRFQRTPLHLAASSGRGPCVKMLIDGGANLFGCDVDHATPLQLAKSSGAVGCTVLLERAMAAARAASVDENGIEQESV